jgi:hypothetical protein
MQLTKPACMATRVETTEPTCRDVRRDTNSASRSSQTLPVVVIALVEVSSQSTALFLCFRQRNSYGGRLVGRSGKGSEFSRPPLLPLAALLAATFYARFVCTTLLSWLLLFWQCHSMLGVCPHSLTVASEEARR